MFAGYWLPCLEPDAGLRNDSWGEYYLLEK
jgi:hypothetical protein